MKSKFIIIGGLIGILIGTIFAFLNPNLLYVGLKINQTFNKGLGFPSNFYSITSGSIYNSYPTIALFFGLIGGIIGFIVFGFIHKKS